MTLPRFPYAIGQAVKGTDCLGKPFSGTVTKQVGPYDVLLDDHVFVPISLIDEPPLPSPESDVFG